MPAARHDKALVVRYYNGAVMAVDGLYQVALGSPGAREDLRDLADRLVTRAGVWCRFRYSKNPEGRK